MKMQKKIKISEEGLTDLPVDGNLDFETNDYYVLPQDGYKMKVSAVTKGGSVPATALGKIIRQTQEGKPTYVGTDGEFIGNTYKMYVIEFNK